MPLLYVLPGTEQLPPLPSFAQEADMVTSSIKLLSEGSKIILFSFFARFFRTLVLHCVTPNLHPNLHYPSCRVESPSIQPKICIAQCCFTISEDGRGVGPRRPLGGDYRGGIFRFFLNLFFAMKTQWGRGGSNSPSSDCFRLQISGFCVAERGCDRKVATSCQSVLFFCEIHSCHISCFVTLRGANKQK